jgi:hypothetical protein
MEVQKIGNNNVSIFLDKNSFEQAQRSAKALSSSNLVPKEYKGNISSTLIALDIASRIGASPLMVMQHLYIVHGKPSWSSTFLIAALNNCGRFNPLKFEITGENMQKGCIAWTTEKGCTERLESPRITMEMAKAEGWIDRAGSKWKTMPELMMRYRAAAFFSRLFAPEVTMGMQSIEEVQDSPNTIDIDSEVVNNSNIIDDDLFDFDSIIEQLEDYSISLKMVESKYKGYNFSDEQKAQIRETGTITEKRMDEIIDLVLNDDSFDIKKFELILSDEQMNELQQAIIDNEQGK